jgi:hypothetical protein
MEAEATAINGKKITNAIGRISGFKLIAASGQMKTSGGGLWFGGMGFCPFGARLE